MSAASNATGAATETEGAGAAAPAGGGSTRPATEGGAASPAGGGSTRPAGGVLLGVVGVAAFSFSLPATKLAVEDLDPWFVAFARAAVATALAVAYLGAV